MHALSGYRREHSDRSNGAAVAPVSAAASNNNSSSTNTSDSNHKRHDGGGDGGGSGGDAIKQLQAETRLADLNGCATKTALASTIRYENMVSLSQGNSPFVGAKRHHHLAGARGGAGGVNPRHLASALTLTSNLLDSPANGSANKANTITAASPTGSEHQYDIPFSHLTPGGVRAAAAKMATATATTASAASTPQTRLMGRTRMQQQQHQEQQQRRRMAASTQSLSSSSGQDYDEMRHHPPPPPFPNPKRRSQNSNRTSSGTNGSSNGNGHNDLLTGSPWRSDGSLLQPRIVEGCSPLVRHPVAAGAGTGGGGWSGSEKSLSIFSGTCVHV